MGYRILLLIVSLLCFSVFVLMSLPTGIPVLVRIPISILAVLGGIFTYALALER